MESFSYFTESFLEIPLCRKGNDPIFEDLKGEGLHTRTSSSPLFLWSGLKTAAQKEIKATTAGRNTVAKCSPKERSTLPRRPILQEYLSRLTNAVLGEDFVRRPSPVKQIREEHRTSMPFSLQGRNPNQ